MGRYRRTVSFPNLTPTNRAGPAHHVRSASLPCGRSHPLIPQLRDEINELRSWESSNCVVSIESGQIIHGLTRLKTVLDSLDDVVQLPQAHDALMSSPQLIEKLLEDFLRFVDSYGTFQACILGLKQEISAAQVAMRRKDDANLSLHVKAQRKIAAEISKLVSAVHSIKDHQIPCAAVATDHYDDELITGVIRDVHGLAVSVSGLAFKAVSSSFGSTRDLKRVGFGFLRKKKGDEDMLRGVTLKRMQEMEEIMTQMEKESERVFRSLISTRVSLLNILTHS